MYEVAGSGHSGCISLWIRWSGGRWVPHHNDVGSAVQLLKHPHHKLEHLLLSFASGTGSNERKGNR